MTVKWKRIDDLFAVCLYRAGKNCLNLNCKEICDILGIKPTSMLMRIENVKYIATNGEKGLSNYAKQTKEQWSVYRIMPKKELITLCNESLDNMLNENNDR